MVKSQRRTNNHARGQVRHDFADYFSPESIIHELCQARVKLAERRDEALFFHNIDQSLPSAEDIPVDWGDIPTDIFPPRKIWNQYRARHRDTRADTNLEALLRAIRHLSRETPHVPWAKRLVDTVEMIRSRALSQTTFVFSPPRIVPQEKNRREHTYRPLASFGLSDKIIDCLTARYFRESLDCALLECCLAYRPRRDSRNDGLDTILRESQLHNRLFVAECDIKGFFDCVSHAVARDALIALVLDAQRRQPGFTVHPRALEIFDAYLTCYSFLRSILQEAELELKTRRGSESEYPWPEEELREFHGVDLDGIGVPQGGALSGVIANAVLHTVDKEMNRACRRVTYLRYCDDMILIAPERSAVVAAFAQYCSAVGCLRLPMHRPQPLKPYKGSDKRSFWSAKSRAVYKWADPLEADGYPWIQFLGYQIRHDGAVRVRQPSINKELTKITRITGRLLASLQPENVPNIRRGPSSIAHSIRMKLISMGVGRRKHGQPLDGPLPKCWAHGFRWLSGQDVITNNLRALDRQRERQINRVVRRLRGLAIPEREARSRRRHGFPFSYMGQFLQLGNESSSDDPAKRHKDRLHL